MFPQFSPNSKVWIYTADRDLTAQDLNEIDAAMNLFLPEWAAHGNALFGGYAVERNRFLILVVDEVQATASGCSIDTSVRFIKELGAKIGVDFFNRMNMVIEEGTNQKIVHIGDLKEYPEAFVFNPMITNLADLRDNWRIKVAESSFV